MSEAEFDVDAAESEYNASRAAGDDPSDGDGGDRGGDAGGDPPGFKTYDEYIADGGDPDMYRGKKAFEAEHNRIDENKRLRKDVRGLQDTVKQTMEAVTDWQSVERTKMRKELDAQLKKNKEDEDLDGALATQKEIDDLDDEPAPAPRQEEHHVIQDFRDANPMLDAEHDDFDQDFNDDVEAFYNGIYQQLSYNGKRKVTDGQIKRALKRALKEANDLHEIEAPGKGEDEPGESRRNSRRGNRQQRTQRRSQRQRTTTPKAEEFVIDNPRNKRQANAAPEVRDMIRTKAFEQAKKRGKDDAAANKAADEASQRFEESLAR